MVKKGKEYKIAFQIRYRYFKYEVILLRLCNVPAVL